MGTHLARIPMWMSPPGIWPNSSRTGLARPLRNCFVDVSGFSSKLSGKGRGDAEVISLFDTDKRRRRSTWRPTFDCPIEDYPLALADGQSVSDSSFIECTHVHTDDQETYNLYHPYSAQLRWYYLSRQTRDEVLIFKNFDSALVPAKTCVHAAFRHSEVPQGVRPRESIEARFFVFTYAENL